jgi:hypothetical protein
MIGPHSIGLHGKQWCDSQVPFRIFARDANAVALLLFNK